MLKSSEHGSELLSFMTHHWGPKDISEGASDYEIGQFREAYDVISSVTNLNFTITDDSNADFKIAIDDDELLGSLDGKMEPPGEPEGGAGDDRLFGGDDADTFVANEDSGADTIQDFAYGEDVISLTDVNFGDEPDQVSRADFLSENGAIDGDDLFQDLGDGRSIRILDVVEENEIGEDAEDYEDLFEFM